MHRQDLLHNDLKPENTLLNWKGVPLICDFDFSCSTEEGSRVRTVAGTNQYKKPNTFSRNIYTDLFALARIFWIEKPDPAAERPSFMDVFQVLHTLSRTQHPKLTADIELVIRTLKNVCIEMREGKSVEHGIIYPTLERIIDIINDLEGKFPVGYESGISY